MEVWPKAAQVADVRLYQHGYSPEEIESDFSPVSSNQPFDETVDVRKGVLIGK